jgi:hypothetical protein
MKLNLTRPEKNSCNMQTIRGVPGNELIQSLTYTLGRDCELLVNC